MTSAALSGPVATDHSLPLGTSSGSAATTLTTRGRTVCFEAHAAVASGRCLAPGATQKQRCIASAVILVHRFAAPSL
jgi:hypothetical protein